MPLSLHWAATIINCSLFHNTVVGGTAAPDGDGVKAGLIVGCFP